MKTKEEIENKILEKNNMLKDDEIIEELVRFLFRGTSLNDTLSRFRSW